MTNNKLALAVRRALRAGSMVSVSTLSVLSAAPAFSADEALEPVEVVITGSRIRQTSGMTTPVPVTSVSSADLVKNNPGAALADQLDKLPQLFQTESAQRGSGALFGNAGASYVNLRGLGSQRTLVLLDGSRVVQDDRGGAVNIGVLPSGLVKNVDIVTGGASAQYGADAVGGVVNFILDRKFQGLKASVSTGITEVGDGFNVKSTVTGGMKIGDKLHVTASMDYNHIDQIERDPQKLGSWFQRWGYVGNPAFVSNAATPGQPVRLTAPNVSQVAFSPFGRIDAVTMNPGVPALTGANAFTFLNNVFTQDGTATRPFVRGAYPNVGIGTMSGGPEYQYADLGQRGGPTGNLVNENSAFVGLQYDLTDRVQVFGNALFGSSASDSVNYRGNPELEDPFNATIFSGNPYLPAAVQAEMTAKGIASFKLNKIGQFPGLSNYNQSETARNVHTMFTWSVGADADLTDNWHLKGTWQSGRSHKYTAVYGEVRTDRIFLAIDAVRDPSTGNIICNVQRFNPTPAAIAAALRVIDPLGLKVDKYGKVLQSPIGLDGSISGCVPINIFGQGNVTAQANDYVTGDKWGISVVKQDFAEALLTGKLFDGWAGSVNAALGATYRSESLTQQAYPIDLDHNGPPTNLPSIGIRGVGPGYATGSPNIFAFSTVPPISGDYDVKEVFGEVNVPIFKLSSGQSLTADAAVRRSTYSSTGSVEAYKLGLDFQLFDDLRFRGTVSRDVREPTFSERFDSQGSGGTVNPDPVLGTVYTITPVTTGNPNLKPEKADTKTFGLVYRPRFIENLQMSVDYYDIKVKDAIGTLGFQRIVNECFTGNAAFCPFIERDATTRVIGRVFDTYLNVAKTTVRGIDYEVQYTAHPDFVSSQPESFVIRGFASQLLERSNQTSSIAAVNEFSGGFTAGVLYPTWKANLSGTYTLGNWSLLISEEYIDRAKINTTFIDVADYQAGRVVVNGVTKLAPDVDDNWLPHYFNMNARLGYSGETSTGHSWDVSLFVTNLFNKDPMIIPSNNARGSSQTVSNNYDAYGRRYVVGFNYKF
jgi:outer membrane receptor protein involved in Fe transport